MGIGYHGDDGGIFHASNAPIEIGEVYTSGDVVGCFFCRTQKNDDQINLVQFTKNGERVLLPRIIANQEWYPTIGISSPGAIVDTYFDPNQFLYNDKGISVISSLSLAYKKININIILKC